MKIRAIKGLYMGERISFFALILMVLLCLPVVIICIFSKEDVIQVDKTPDMESYLVGIVYQQIPEDYPMEAIKAQVVLARSSWVRQLEDHVLVEEDWEKAAEDIRMEMKERRFETSYKNISKAIVQTKDEVLSYDDSICYGVFHRVSAGHTRNSEDIFEKNEYPYLIGVESVIDQESEAYLTGHYFTPDFLEKEFRTHGIRMSFSDGDEIVVKTRDVGGYAQRVQIGNVVCSGEEIREMLHLSSSAFSIELYKEKIRFLCRGQGHGMGLSQYGASKMAKEGSTYREILMYYFPQAEIIDVETV